MAALNLSNLDPAVRREVTRRGLFLIAPEPKPPPDQGTYLFICTDPNPIAYGVTRVGYVIEDGGMVVVAMKSAHTARHAELHQIRGFFSTWEQGVMAVLREFDRYRKIH